MLLKKEAINAIEAIHNEKGLNYSNVIRAVESSVERTAKQDYGNAKLLAKIFPKRSMLCLYHVIEIVEKRINKDTISLDVAVEKYGKDFEIGDTIIEELQINFNSRALASIARKAIVSNVEIIEQELEYEMYKDKIGTMLEGVIDRVNKFGADVLLKDGSTIMIPFNCFIPGEDIKPDQRIKFVIDYKETATAKKIIGSRISENFVKALFEEFVPEIRDNLLSIKKVIRFAGYASKVVLSRNDPNIRPVGVCIGIGGSRIRNIKRELHTEFVDIIEWSTDLREMIKSSLSPINVKKITIEDEIISVYVNKMDVVKALGRNNKNAVLLSKVFEARVNILPFDGSGSFEGRNFDRNSFNNDSSGSLDKNALNTSIDNNASKEFNIENTFQQDAPEFNNKSSDTDKLIEELEVNDVIAMLLVSSGFSNIEKIVASSPEDICSATDMEFAIVEEIYRRASFVMNDAKKS